MERLSNSQLSIQVAKHGAELSSIVCDGHEYLWQADPAFWKRHSPVLFPIVGRVWNDEYRHAGQTYHLSQHGFARDMDFELVAADERGLLFRLESNEETLKKYPFHFVLEIGYRLDGRKIIVEWKVKNRDHSTLHFQIGAHPAFNYPDFDEDSDLKGYFGFDKKAGLHKILISEGGCVDTSKAYPLTLDGDGLLPIDNRTFNQDALILEGNQVKEVTLYNKEHHPYVTLHFNTPALGLWSPDKPGAPFVCIEPWYGRCDEAHYEGEFAYRDWMQHLSPEMTFEGGYEIEIR